MPTQIDGMDSSTTSWTFAPLPTHTLALAAYCDARDAGLFSPVRDAHPKVPPQVAMEAGIRFALEAREAKRSRDPLDRDDQLFRAAQKFSSDARVTLEWLMARDDGGDDGVLDAPAMLARPPNPVRFAIDGLVPYRGSLMIGGSPGAGKSAVSRTGGLACARGGEWLGRTCQPGRVLFVVTEGEGGVDEVIAELRTLGLEKGDDVRLACEPPERGAPAWFAARVRRHRPAYVFLDTLGGVLEAHDGNSYMESQTALRPILGAVREVGATLIAIHHHRKQTATGAKGVLGSTRLAGSFDHILAVVRDGDGDDPPRVVVTEKHRGGEPMRRTFLERCETTGRIDLGGGVAALKRREDEQAILDTLAELGPGLYRHEVIREKAEVSEARTRDALRSLVEARHVVRSGSGRRGDPIMYRIAVSQLSTDHTG